MQSAGAMYAKAGKSKPDQFGLTVGGFEMFTDITTVMIEKDGNFAKYVKIIRAYDSSLSLGQIKKAMIL